MHEDFLDSFLSLFQNLLKLVSVIKSFDMLLHVNDNILFNLEFFILPK